MYVCDLKDKRNTFYVTYCYYDITNNINYMYLK